MKKLITLILFLGLSQTAFAGMSISKISTTCTEAQIKSYFSQGLTGLRAMGPGKFMVTLNTDQLSKDDFNKTLRQKGCLEKKTSFKNLEEALKNAEIVTSLDLSRQNLTEVPAGIAKLKNLKTLGLTNNNLSTLPDWVVELKSLENLYLSNNQFTVFPKQVLQLASLKKLEIANNKLTSLPTEIGDLTQLTLLSIGKNQLKNLPDSLYNLTNLEDLKIYGNQISTLSPKLNNLTHLQKFMVGNKFHGGNPIQALPSNLGGLVSLKSIDLPQTQITNLPDSLLALPNLKTIWVPASMPPETLQNLKQKYKAITFLNM